MSAGAAVPLDAGMPPLDLSRRTLSFFEFWPPALFYAPVAAFWIYLGLRHGGMTLPTAANPGLPVGGLVGESKSEVLAAMGPLARSALSPFVTITRRPGQGGAGETLAAAEAAMATAGLSLPLVAKPDIACRGAGIKLIAAPEDLHRYIQSFPEGAQFLLQKLVDKLGEAGIFYVRHPEAARGDIPSLTLKYFPHVTGDGVRSLRRLILDDPRAGRVPHLYLPRHESELDRVLAAGERKRLVFAGNHARGTIFRDGTADVTEALRDRVEAIARDIDGYYFGRLDVRFSDYGAFLRGEDLTLIEVNGAGGEQTHIWDANIGLGDAYGALFRQFKALFEIGAANRRRGFAPASLRDLTAAYLKESRLTRLYPATD